MVVEIKKCIIDIETESLDPKEGRIICIGTKDIDSGKTVVFHDDDERQMLEDFLDYCHRKQFGEIIGYNVLFDFRFIFARCLKFSIRTNGFFKSVVTDLMATMKSVRNIYSLNKPGTLNEWTEFLFGTGKVPLPDSICNMFEQGKLSQIIEYNKRDIEITFMLWKRVQEVLGNAK